MAFERYITKNGKKLGPYYYENVRHEGKVKTVYIGRNPHENPKHKIKKPLLALIIILTLALILGGSLFYMKNKAVLKQAKELKEEPNFSVDQILLKVLVRSKEYTSRQIRVMNIDTQPISISIKSEGLFDILSIDSKEFSIKPGQTKIVNLNFSSFIKSQSIEQEPGVYIGKLVMGSEKSSREIPIIIEIETKNVLFDTNLNPVALDRRVKQGEQTTIEVRLFNLESVDAVNVDMEYFVKDMDGNTIITESETAVVKTQASFYKTITVPKNLKPGSYVFAANALFGNSIGTSSYVFEVVSPDAASAGEFSFVEFCKNDIYCLGLSITTLLLIFLILAYFYFYIGAFLYDRISTGLGRVSGKKDVKIEKERDKLRREVQKLKLEKEFDKLKEERRKFEDLKRAEKKRLKKPGFFIQWVNSINEKRKEKSRARDEKLRKEEKLNEQKRIAEINLESDKEKIAQEREKIRLERKKFEEEILLHKEKLREQLEEEKEKHRLEEMRKEEERKAKKPGRMHLLIKSWKKSINDYQRKRQKEKEKQLDLETKSRREST